MADERILTRIDARTAVLVAAALSIVFSSVIALVALRSENATSVEPMTQAQGAVEAVELPPGVEPPTATSDVEVDFGDIVDRQAERRDEVAGSPQERAKDSTDSDVSDSNPRGGETRPGSTADATNPRPTATPTPEPTATPAPATPPVVAPTAVPPPTAVPEPTPIPEPPVGVDTTGADEDPVDDTAAATAPAAGPPADVEIVYFYVEPPTESNPNPPRVPCWDDGTGTENYICADTEYGG